MKHTIKALFTLACAAVLAISCSNMINELHPPAAGTRTGGGAAGTGGNVAIQTTAFESVAADSTGLKLVAAQWIGRLLRSTDGGATWSVLTGSPNKSFVLDYSWNRVASSADGTHLAALFVYNGVDATPHGEVWISGDSGATWTQTNGYQHYDSGYGFALSADGTTLVIATCDSSQSPFVRSLWHSSDFGATWAENTDFATNNVDNGLYFMALSSDGTNLFTDSAHYTGSTFNLYLYSSIDAGASGTAESKINATPSNVIFTDGDTGGSMLGLMSADGIKRVFVYTDSTISAINPKRYALYSSDSGGNWTSSGDIASVIWPGATTTTAAASDLSVIYTVNQSDNLPYKSTDHGATWQVTGFAPDTSGKNVGWVSLCASANGTILVGVLYRQGSSIWPNPPPAPSYEAWYSGDSGGTWTQR